MLYTVCTNRIRCARLHRSVSFCRGKQVLTEAQELVCCPLPWHQLGHYPFSRGVPPRTRNANVAAHLLFLEKGPSQPPAEPQNMPHL